MAERSAITPLALPPYRSLSGDRLRAPILPDVVLDEAYRLPPLSLASPRMVVVGVGGAGSNALRLMPGNGTVRCVALNTDAQALPYVRADARLCLGEQLTQGRGTGGAPEIGEHAAEASRHHILSLLRKADLVFVAAGLGGGTGTGAAPVVARLAHELGALVIGLATLPFAFEGQRRRQIAEAGLVRLEAAVDALFVIPNDRLLQVSGQGQTLDASFALADGALCSGVAGIAEIVLVPGIINVDFADVRAILRGAGRSLLAVGEASGQERATRAVDDAMSGGWLDADIRDARRVLLNLTCAPDLTLFEVTTIAAQVTRRIAPEAECILGTVIDPTLTDTLRLTLIAAGLPG